MACPRLGAGLGMLSSKDTSLTGWAIYRVKDGGLVSAQLT